MTKGSKKEANGGKAKSDPEAEERKRLKRLAVSKGMISDTPAKPSASLSLSKLVVKHHGKDIIKKSQRKNKYLFSFPGLLAPVAGGKIGELKDLGTKNPILYLDFPQGRMKLFGTIMYPKNRYLTLQFSRGGKNVMCEDSFDTMIVFSDAWWIGKKEENPGEARLDFPKELTGEQPVECDFRGGAGSTTLFKSGVNQHVPKFVKEQTPMKDLEDDSFKSENDVTEILERTPTRHSARTSNKSYKFAEASSNDASSASDDDISLIAEKKNEAKNSNMHESNADTKEPLTQSKKVSRSSSEVADGVPCNKRGSLIQSTISTLFKKAEEKGEPRSSRKTTPLPVAVEQKSQRTKSSRKINVDDDETDGKRKKRKLMKGTNLKTVETQLEDENDAMEEFSSSSQETDGSDQDWSGDL